MVGQHPDRAVGPVPPGGNEQQGGIERKDQGQRQAEQESRIGDHHGRVPEHVPEPGPVLTVQPGPGLAVHVGPAQLAPPAAPVVPDDRAGHVADAVAAVHQPPAEVDVGSVGEALVEPADRVEDRAPEGQVDGGALGQVAGVPGGLGGLVVEPAAARRGQRQARRDVLVLPQRRDQAPSQPGSGWQPASVNTMISPRAARTPALR